MNFRTLALLFFIPLVSAPIASADKLYDNFNNPPNSARPFVRWAWDTKCPSEKEINRQLDTFKEAGFGGVEICPAVITEAAAKMLKFTADEAKKRDMLVDLAISWPLTAPSLQPEESIQVITLGKKSLKGPAPFHADVNDLIKLASRKGRLTADKTRNISPDPNCRLMFIRLIPLDLGRYTSGAEFISQIRPDGSVDFNIPDGNNVIYIGVLHKNLVAGARVSTSVIDPLNKRAVEKYFNNLSAILAPALGGNLGDSLHAISLNNLNPAGFNWTSDFEQEFIKRRGLDLLSYLPAILDDSVPKNSFFFYETVRRTRYDFCKTFTELLNERFLATFHDFCRGNAVFSRLQFPDNPWSLNFLDSNLPFYIPQSSQTRDAENWNLITSSAGRLAGKSIISCQLSITPRFLENSEEFFRIHDLAFESGINQFICNRQNAGPKNRIDRNARLSVVFQHSQHQAKVAILCPTADIWSDFGFYNPGFLDSCRYLFPLWQALNHNGFTCDYIDPIILQQSTWEDGSLHFPGTASELTYDTIIVPDIVSIDFEPVRALRFYAQAGGKIIFIGRPPEAAPGFKDLVKRSATISLTMEHIRKNDPNRVVFVPAPDLSAVADKNKNDLTSWFAPLAQQLNLRPTVKISPHNPNLFFVHYLADGLPGVAQAKSGRDIFFFTNIDRSSPLSFNAQFDTADKTPWLWDPQTGNRNIFPYGSKKDSLDIELEPLDSVLLVFEPNRPDNSPVSE